MKLINVSLFIFITISLILSCGKNSKKINDYYTVTDSIKLESPSSWFSPRKLNNFILTINSYEHRLELYSESGKLLSYCGNYGKGPGEFTKPKFLDIYDNIIYLVDRSTNKIVIIELDKENSKLKYISEFHVNVNPADVCVINKNKILVSVAGDLKNIKLYNNKGELLQEYSIPKKENFKNNDDVLNSLCFIENCDKEYILIGGIYSMKLYFCKFDNNNNSLIKIEEKYVKSSVEGKRDEKSIYGLGLIYSVNDNYYVSFNPDIRIFKGNYLEIYDKNGCFLGNSYLKDNITYFIFSSLGDTLWFMKPENDTTIYIAERNIQ